MVNPPEYLWLTNGAHNKKKSRPELVTGAKSNICSIPYVVYMKSK